MYSVNNDINLKGKMEELSILNSFSMGSENRVFQIHGSAVRHIQVTGSELATPMVSELVQKKYQKLIAYLTDLLTDDDDTGDSIREALNHIEKFRLEIKNKYRDFLKQKELEMMSKQLLILKKEAEERYMELRNSFLLQEENKRSK